MNKIRVFEAFSGIGAQAMALKRLQADYPDVVEFDFVGTSEIESNAIKAYNAVHGDVKCYGDITKIDWNEVPDFDLFTMSSPCQDFSVAGRQAGAEEGSGTRSSLLWECRKAIIAKKPRYILFENVSAVVSKKFIRGFNKWQAELESYGYTNYAKVLNSKDFGIPQNRERLFMVSILDCDRTYHFPEPFKLEKRIKDILEPYGTVDDSFYFSAKQLFGMFKYCDRKKDEGCGFQTNFRTEDSIATCVTSRYGAEYTNTYLREPALQQRLSLYGNNAQAGRVYDVEGIAPTVKCQTGGNSEPKILTSVRSEEMKELRKKGIERFNGRVSVPREDGISNTITTVTKDNMLIEPTIIQRPHGFNDGGEFSETAPTVTTSSWKHNNFCKEPMDFSFDNLPDNTVLQDSDGKGYLWQDGSLWRVRKLHPIETSRLMDVADEDFYKMQDAGISKSALYGLFGNSIVVNVLYHIFRKLWIETENESAQKSLFDF